MTMNRAQANPVTGTKRILVGAAIALAILAPRWAPGAAPSLDNADGATNVLSITAVLNGTLVSTGGLPTQVYACWGLVDGGTTFGSWGNTNDLGIMPEGPLSLTVTNLTPNRLYYYRFYATNLDGSTWADATTNFRTLVKVGPAPIDLKTCSTFTILAYSTVTTTGGGLINGNVGLSPAGSMGIPPAQINGTIHNGDPVAAQAQADLTAAIIAASPAGLPGGINVGNGELGGRVLAPGVYQSASASYAISISDLTLYGGPDDVWVFQMAETLTVGVGRQVILAGGARPQNIFWQVGSSATLDTSSVFKGTVMAYASVTMNASSTLDGRALAQTGAVTFNGTGGSLPMPDAPVFTRINQLDTNSATVHLSTPAHFPLTLESCPDLLLANWTPVTTDTPVTNLWAFTDLTATAGVTQRFYRAFLTPY